MSESILTNVQLAELAGRRWMYSYTDERPDHTVPDSDRTVGLRVAERDALVATVRQKDKEIERLQSENERLKRGDFTPDELQGLCHNLSEQDRCAFFEGCTKYQEQLFGTSAVAELRKEMDR